MLLYFKCSEKLCSYLNIFGGTKHSLIWNYSPIYIKSEQNVKQVSYIVHSLYDRCACGAIVSTLPCVPWNCTLSLALQSARNRQCVYRELVCSLVKLFTVRPCVFCFWINLFDGKSHPSLRTATSCLFDSSVFRFHLWLPWSVGQISPVRWPHAGRIWQKLTHKKQLNITLNF